MCSRDRFTHTRTRDAGVSTLSGGLGRPRSGLGRIQCWFPIALWLWGERLAVEQKQKKKKREMQFGGSGTPTNGKHLQQNLFFFFVGGDEHTHTRTQIVTTGITSTTHGRPQDLAGPNRESAGFNHTRDRLQTQLPPIGRF